MESEPQLSQAEADALIALHKVRAGEGRYDFVKQDKLRVPLQSIDGREAFTLDLWRSGKIQLERTHQLRGRRSICLVRLDLAGAPHTNPDKERVACPHLHVYKEGFGLQWAKPIDPTEFRDPGDPITTLADFLGFCQVVDPPDIHIGLYP